MVVVSWKAPTCRRPARRSSSRWGSSKRLCGPDEDIDEGEVGEERVPPALGQAPGDDDQAVLVRTLEPAGDAQVPQQPGVGLLADAAGVVDEDVAVVGLGHLAEPHARRADPAIRSESCSFIWHPKVRR